MSALIFGSVYFLFPVIIIVKNVPSDFSTMKKYFSNISVKHNGGHTWFQVWLGQDESPDNLLTNVKHWSTSSNYFMYEKDYNINTPPRTTGYYGLWNVWIQKTLKWSYCIHQETYKTTFKLQLQFYVYQER